MSGWSARLAEQGITLPAVAAPLAAYLPAVRTQNLVFTAGQLPMVEGRLAATGKVGAEVSVDDAKRLARQCALNALAAVKSGRISQSRLDDAVTHIIRMKDERAMFHPYVDVSKAASAFTSKAHREAARKVAADVRAGG